MEITLDNVVGYNQNRFQYVVCDLQYILGFMYLRGERG